MQDFIEKWNSDTKYKTKIKLTLYTLFVVFVAIFAVSGSNNIQNNEDNNLLPDKNNLNSTNDQNSNNKNINESNNQNNTYQIELPREYNYQIDININEINHKYVGSKTELRENITKESNGTSKKYIYDIRDYSYEK